MKILLFCFSCFHYRNSNSILFVGFNEITQALEKYTQDILLKGQGHGVVGYDVEFP